MKSCCVLTPKAIGADWKDLHFRPPNPIHRKGGKTISADSQDLVLERGALGCVGDGKTAQQTKSI